MKTYNVIVMLIFLFINLFAEDNYKLVKRFVMPGNLHSFVAFDDSTAIYTAGRDYYYKILLSDTTVTRIDLPENNAYSPLFGKSINTAISHGDNASFLITKDKGATFDYIKLDSMFFDNDISPAYFYLDFIDSLNYLITNKIGKQGELLFKSVDAGFSWSKVDTIEGFTFKTSDTVSWAVIGNYITRSSDVGASWDTVVSNFNTIKKNYDYCMPFQFYNDTFAYYLEECKDDNSIKDSLKINITKDGGYSWKVFVAPELDVLTLKIIDYKPYLWYQKPIGNFSTDYVEEWETFLPFDYRFMSNEMYTFKDDGSLEKIFDYNESVYYKSDQDWIQNIIATSENRIWVGGTMKDSVTGIDSVQILVLDQDTSVASVYYNNDEKIYNMPEVKYIKNSYLIVNTKKSFDLTLQIFNLQGRIVKSNKVKSTGKNISLNLIDLSSGMYFLRLKGNNFNLTQHLIISK